MGRRKGITIWERYVEFMVIGLIVLLLIAFAVMQINPNRNAVEVAGIGSVGPGEVDGLLRAEAERLSAALSPDAPPPVLVGEPPALLASFENRMASPVSPVDRLVLMHASPPLTIGERIRADARYVVPEIPPPNDVVAQQFFDALADGVVDQHEQLRAMFNRTPHDVTWITSAMLWDKDALLENFRAGSPDADPAPIPLTWYGDRPTPIDVVVERQELVDGQWSEPYLVDALPGQLSFRADMREGIDANRREGILRTLRNDANRRQVIQPDFLPTRNSAFTPPDPRLIQEDLDDEPDPARRQLNQQLRRLAGFQAQRDQILQQLRDLGVEPGQRRDRQRPDRRDRDDEDGRRPAPGPSGLGGATGDGPGRDRERDQRAIDSLQRQLERLDRQIADIEQQLPAEVIEEIDATEDTGELLVWFHDLEIQPGRTYRYRARIDVYNPFFARTLHLVEEQQDLADPFVLSSDFSEWSEPIEVRPPLEIFIARAYPPDRQRAAGPAGQEMGSASVDVFRFYDGQWWESRFNVEPGQRIGSVRDVDRRGDGPTIDFSTDWFLLDIVEDTEGSSRDGRNARAVLLNLDGSRRDVRHPSRDAEHPLRERLREQMRVALGR